jgi:transcription initiation factor TFIID subunit 6
MAEEIESAQTQVRHVLTKELQAFFEKITEAILGNETTTLQAALNSLRSDPGLHQLLPFFCKFISDKVTENLHNLRSLLSLMKTVDALLTNPHIHVDHYVRLATTRKASYSTRIVLTALRYARSFIK